jgi:RimJ/RimL family protein N-acetyltransferase
MTDSVLQGQCVYLRRLERGDLDRTWEWLHRPDVYERLGVAVPFSHTGQEAWFQGLEQSRDKLVFAVCRTGDNGHIGNVSLDSIDLRHRNARLSVFIASDALRGKGYGSDALRVLVRYAFEYLNLHRLWCKSDADSPDIARFYERAGFLREGTLREHEFHRGAYVDKALWGIVRDPAGAPQ